MVLVPDTLHIDPIQARHQIVDWEIYKDKFWKGWKVIGMGGNFSVYKNFEQLIRASDREDLDTLWRLVQEKLKTTWKPDVKEQEVWVEF